MSPLRATPTLLAAMWVLLAPAGAASASLSTPTPDQPGAVSAAGVQDPANDAYERGRELIRAGNPEAALVLWIALQDSLWEAEAEDPRIGVAFMETVVEHGLDEYREVATQIFYWAFSGRAVASEKGRAEILAEGRRTYALADSVIAEYWLRRGQADPAALAIAIKRFWLERDPTPTPTTLNERLVEHWVRIVHARRNYIYNYSSPYRTDDRGVFYVKYGEPDRIASGILDISSFDMDLRGVSIEEVVAVDLAPRYEIWRYADIEPPAFTYFLFGNVDQTGPFEYVKGLSEIIGPNARTQRINGIRAQYYLELFYYGELGRMGGPYGERQGELDRLWGQQRQPSEGVLEARSVQHSVDDTREAQRSKPPSFSEWDSARRSALSAQLARVLVGTEPRLLALAVASPLWQLQVDSRSLRGDLALAPFAASHAVIIRDRNLNEIGRADMVPVNERAEMTTVEMRHALQIGHVTVTAEHIVEGQELEDAEEIGVLPGHQHFTVPPPLRRDAVQLEVSDLIVGIPPESVTGLDSLPLPLLPATQFSRQDPVRVFFDIYHPTGMEDGDTRSFNVRVLVVPFTGLASPEQLARPEAGGRAAVTLTLESEAPTGRHYFDLDLRNERAGLQQLVLEVTDTTTGVSRARAISIILLQR